MKNPIKRLSLGISLLLVLVTISSTSEYTFASSNKPEISQEQANRIAAYYIDIYQKEQVPSWLNATINKSSTIYYSVNNQPVAYEISVLCDKNEYAGYMWFQREKIGHQF